MLPHSDALTSYVHAQQVEKVTPQQPTWMQAIHTVQLTVQLKMHLVGCTLLTMAVGQHPNEFKTAAKHPPLTSTEHNS